MNKNRHLTLEERIIIESWLQKKESFKSIGRKLGRDSTTIAKEVKNHIQFKQILYPWPGYEREYFS